MKICERSNKFLSSWKYVEIAKYVPSLNRVIRIKSGDKTTFITDEDIPSFREDNDNTGLYTSIWKYNYPDIEKSTRLSSLYFDLDNTNGDISLEETIRLKEYLLEYIPEESIIVYFTGKKGFHIECEAVALGINPSNKLPEIFRHIANKVNDKLNLTSLDFSVYDPRRMWRLEGTMHQDTSLYKNKINADLLYTNMDTIKQYCINRFSNIVIDQSFSSKANEWFRDFTYYLEIEKEKSKDFMSYFNKYGSSAFKKLDESEREFTKEKLLTGCTAVQRLYDQAKEKKFLEHEARLFLCSILTYSEDSIKFLHEILSNCDDYNWEKSNSHIRDWVKRRELGIGGRPYTCERANAVGVGCGECSLEQKKKWIKVGDKYIETEEKSSPSPVRFAYKLKNKGGENV